MSAALQNYGSECRAGAYQDRILVPTRSRQRDTTARFRISNSKSIEPDNPGLGRCIPSTALLRYPNGRRPSVSDVSVTFDCIRAFPPPPGRSRQQNGVSG